MTPLWSAEVEARIRSEAYSLDPQKTPDHVQQCTRCVVTNQRPRITFDAEGVCSACRYAERQQYVNWDNRREALEVLLKRHRLKDGYNCIVPASGGKDSSTVAWRLKNEFGMNPLLVKWAPFVYTDIGRKNMDALVHAGFDVVEMTTNGHLHRKLARLSFEYLGDHFQPFVYGQLAWPMHMAAMLDVQLVFGAENGEAAYGGDGSANDARSWAYQDWERVYLKGVGLRRLIEIGKNLGALTDAEIRSLSPFYTLPMYMPRVEYHWLAYYLPHHPQGNFYFAQEHCGFTPNPERNVGTFSKYASIDDATDDFHYLLGYAKFGIGRCVSDAAHEVRDGDLTREEALALVAKYDGEFPPKHKYDLFKDYLGLDDEQFGRVMDRFSRPASLPA
jgi:N-acetyl sugar amidotransferase